MRIHLPLHPHHFAPPPTSGPSAPPGPLLQLGGDLVLVELQGQLSWEGDKENGVIGVIGLDRPDKPTLHLGPHHLLHGKFTNLQKPYAIIRRVVGDASTSSNTASAEAGDKGKGVAVQGDASEEEEESSDEEEEELFPKEAGGEEREDRDGGMRSSSPFSYAPSTPKDYSSDIASSPPPSFSGPGGGKRPREEDDEDADEFAEDGGVEERRKRKRAEEEEKRKKKEKRERWRRRQREERKEKERARHYAVVGVVRRKVVFTLRPEPLVAPTILPE
ncbi:hypothetical protein IAT38_001842 [Cryptococcus sp. DSM 104549]